MKKQFRRIFAIVLIIVMLFSNINISYAASRTDGIENFPESYKSYLNALKTKYPNWTFTALYTGLDWGTVINNEANPFTRSLVPSSYSSPWKSQEPGCYDPNTGIYTSRDTSAWVTASTKAVEYSMDPRNFLDEKSIFMFEALSYKAGSQTQAGVEKILYNSFMYNTLISYVKSDGATENTQEKYSDVIMQAAVESGVSPYYIAAKIIQEIGRTKSNAVTGTLEGYIGLYNYYNIGASPNPDGSGALINGLIYARDDSKSYTYNRPWTSPKQAIIGGAKFLGESYIKRGQDTAYLQKFDVDNSDGALYWHQWATNIIDPASKATTAYNGYNSMGALAEAKNFVIPVYNNMSSSPAIHPELDSRFSYETYAEGKIFKTNEAINIYSQPDLTAPISIQIPKDAYIVINQRSYDANGTLSYRVTYDVVNNFKGWIDPSKIYETTAYSVGISTGSSLNIRTSANGVATGSQIQNTNTYMIVKEVVNIGGSLPIWLKVISNPITQETNYVYSGYIRYTTPNPVPVIPITGIALNKSESNILKGSSITITSTVSPIDASNKNISWTTSNSSVATVNNGVVTAVGAGTAVIKAIAQDGSGKEASCNVTVSDAPTGTNVQFTGIRNYGNEITGINPLTKMSSIRSKITTNLTMKFLNSQGTEITDEANSNVATGSKIRLVDGSNNTVFEYTSIIYGDVSGDGNISSSDYVYIKNYIMATKTLNNVEKTGADVNKDGKVSSSDYVLIKNHIMGTSSISQ